MWNRVFGAAALLGLGILLPVGLAAQEQGQEPRQEETSGGESTCQLEPTDAATTAQSLINEAREAPSPEEAVETYGRALALVQDGVDSEVPVDMILGAMAHIGLGEYETADRLLDRFVELKPGCHEPATNTRYNAWVDLYNEAIRAYQAGDLERALERFELANQIHTDTRSLNNAAFLHEQGGNRQRALELYRRAVNSGGEPEQVRSALASLSDLLMVEGRAEEAARAYEPYLEEHPDDVVVQVRYAVALAEAGQQAEATPIFERVLGAEGLTSAQWNEVGVGLFNAEQYDQSVEAFRNAHATNPHNKEGLENLVAALIQAEAHGEAAELAPELVERYPYEEEHYRVMANALANVDRDREALQAMQSSENLPFLLDGVRMTSSGEGSYVIRGTIEGRPASAGRTVTVPFELVGRDGQVIATDELELDVPAAGQTSRFELSFQVDGEAAGFRYRTSGGSDS